MRSRNWLISRHLLGGLAGVLLGVPGAHTTPHTVAAAVTTLGHMNPAALLHDLLTQYREADGSAYLATRWHLDDEPTTNGLSEGDRVKMLEAAGWLSRISLIIDALDRQGRRVSIYRRNYVTWVDSTLGIGKDWSRSYTREDVCPQAAMDALDALADAIDVITPKPDNQIHAQLVELLTEVSELLDADDTLSERLRTHLRRVLDHLRNCVEHPEAYDIHDVACAVDDVLIACQAAHAESTKEGLRERWGKFHQFYVAPTITGLLASAAPGAIEAAGAFISRAIGS